MLELMFVLKSLALSVVVMMCLQVKVGSSSLETHAEHWIQTSSVSNYLQKVSSGAVLAIRNAASITKDFVTETFGDESATQRAGRLNLEFKRSSKYQQEQEQSED
ncbi:MAG: hypothetical protein ACAH59_09865 [Pseudobdellovibrionaceae bacterium]